MSYGRHMIQGKIRDIRLTRFMYKRTGCISNIRFSLLLSPFIFLLYKSVIPRYLVSPIPTGRKRIQRSVYVTFDHIGNYYFFIFLNPLFLLLGINKILSSFGTRNFITSLIVQFKDTSDVKDTLDLYNPRIRTV